MGVCLFLQLCAAHTYLSWRARKGPGHVHTHNKMLRDGSHINLYSTRILSQPVLQSEQNIQDTVLPVICAQVETVSPPNLPSCLEVLWARCGWMKFYFCFTYKHLLNSCLSIWENDSSPAVNSDRRPHTEPFCMDIKILWLHRTFHTVHICFTHGSPEARWTHAHTHSHQAEPWQCSCHPDKHYGSSIRPSRISTEFLSVVAGMPAMRKGTIC